MRMNEASRERQKHQMSKSTTKGSDFESRVRRLLAAAKRESDGNITFEAKPKIELENGETRFPDFRLIIARSYEKRCILIECQNRKRSSKPILEKIQYIRSKHQSQTFIFVYPKRIGSELAKRLAGHGVTLFNVVELEEYLGELARDVRAYWTSKAIDTQHAHTSTAKRKKMLETRQVTFHSHPDARQQLEEFLEDKSEIPADPRPDGTQTAFG